MALYLNGGKLLLNGSQLAGTRSCCCEEDGDSCDFCGDYCLYKLDIVSPLPLTSPQIDPCLGFLVSSIDNTVVFCEGQSSYHISFLEKRQWGQDQPGFYAIYEAIALGVVSPYEPSSQVEAFVYLYCDFTPEFPEGNWFLALRLEAQLATGNIASLIVKTSLRSLSSACSRKANADCDVSNIGSQLTRRYLSTPVEFTVTYDNDGFGSWQTEDIYIPPGEQFPCGVQLAENFTATFRITERPSCRTVECDCNVNIDGLKVTFEGKEFTLGTFSEITEGDTVWTHEFLGGIYGFYKTTYYPGSATPVETIVVSLLCDNSDPEAPLWLAEITTDCIPFAMVDGELVQTGYAQRAFDAHFLCFEAADDCTGPAGGTYIPLGGFNDVVEAEGSPFLQDGLPNCGAPDVPQFVIEQNCGA